ncbi:MAG TPA: hydroxymethylbilane synthase [Planctomycetaceae bacterium]|nr:hydroxymethylbilane synthase [Planctomycetaceae bacterium]
MSGSPLRIATRASNLALWQANFVADLLRAQDPGQEVELVHVTTTGDRVRDVSLTRLGGVGVFTREIQQALLENRADVAVHSLKDLPTESVDGLTLAAVPERGSAWDALVLPADSPLSPTAIRGLPKGARIGTGSLRRRAQLLFLRPDLEFLDLRGNVETRLRKLDEGACDALILAEAGLDRLGLSARISARLAPPELFPAVGQGALGLECRADDASVRSRLERLTHPATWSAVTAERRLLSRLGAGCHAPVGVATTVDKDELTLEAVVLSPDGKQRLHSQATGPARDPFATSDRVAEILLTQGAAPLIAAAENP